MPEQAWAQAPSPAGTPHHTGFIAGFAFGGGSLTCSECKGGGGPHMRGHLGWLLTPRFAILFDGGGMQPGVISGSTYVSLNGAVQYFTSERVWVKTGIGSGRLALNSNVDGIGEPSLNLFGAVGGEVLHTRHFGFDLSLRYEHGVRKGSNPRTVSLLLGFTFY